MNYFELLDRIVKGAEYLDNPLIQESDFIKGMQLYIELCVQAEKIRKEAEER